MMFFLVLFCFGAVFGDGNVTAPAVGQNVTGPAPIVTTAAPQIDLVSLFTQFITEARVNDAKHTKEIKRIHNLVTEKFSVMTERFATINSAVSTMKSDVTTVKSDVTKLKKDAQYCVTGYKKKYSSTNWEKETIPVTFSRTFKSTPYISVSTPGAYSDEKSEAPAFYAGVFDATSTGFNIGLWLDVNGKPWTALVYYIACGKI